MKFHNTGANTLGSGELSELSGLAELGVVALGADQLEISLQNQLEEHTSSVLNNGDVVGSEPAVVEAPQPLFS